MVNHPPPQEESVPKEWQTGVVVPPLRTSKSEVMVLSRKPVDCLLQVGNVYLPQVKDFKYFRVLFTITRLCQKGS